MKLQFTKMHGLGNDFVVFDFTQTNLSLSSDIIQRLSDRHTGIGFDQLLVIEPARHESHDFFYRIFNANGQEVEMCGNGARCVAYYIFSEHLTHKNSIRLGMISGDIESSMTVDAEVTVNMGQPIFTPDKIPFITNQPSPLYELEIEGELIQLGVVSLGNPHAVIVVKDVLQAPVQRIGSLLQQSSAFPNQVNVGFMEIVSANYIRLKVYERGVGETLACGSGACAAVVIGRSAYSLAPEVTVELPGGTLTVNWQNAQADILITGSAVKVFKGEVLV